MVAELLETGETNIIPIEDIGIVILDHQQITITQSLMAKLLANNTALITCDATHPPVGLHLCLIGHTLQSQKFKAQIAVTLPLKKQLWQQTEMAKIENQASLLKSERAGNNYLLKLASTVRSGAPSNNEAKAAMYY